jgi:hypothetical protein
MALNSVEQEAVVLRAVWGMIDDMVNFAIFMPLGQSTRDTNLLPQTSQALRLFNILLGDFLSPLARKGRGGLPFGLRSPPEGARTSDLTFLFYLRGISADPQLAREPDRFARPVEAFSHWLEQPSFVERVWLPSIGVETDLSIERRTWIRICADIGKHTFARLEPNVAKIERIISEQYGPVEAGSGFLVLEEFWEWFHTNLFAYHASTIAEFLNEIRWGIFEYLAPEFERAFQHGQPEPLYSFDVPQMITNPLARSMYWDLMNLCRSRPWFPRFTVTQSLKGLY